MPVTVKPALANSTARGRPTYPSPTMPTRARLLRIFSARISAVAVVERICGSVIKLVFSHRGRKRRGPSSPVKLALGDDLGRTCKKDIAIEAQIDGSGRGQDADGAVRHSAGDGGGGSSGRSRTAAHRLPCPPLPETDIDGVLVDGFDEGHVGAIREVRVPLDLGAKGAPVEIEIRHRHGALRI